MLTRRTAAFPREILEIDLRACVVWHYGYRTAEVPTDIENPNRFELTNELKDLHRRLADAVNVRVDNHVVFGVHRPQSAEPLYIQFRDFTVTLGNTCRKIR